MASLGKWQYRAESGCYIREDGKIITREYAYSKLVGSSLSEEVLDKLLKLKILEERDYAKNKKQS